MIKRRAKSNFKLYIFWNKTYRINIIIKKIAPAFYSTEISLVHVMKVKEVMRLSWLYGAISDHQVSSINRLHSNADASQGIEETQHSRLSVGCIFTGFRFLVNK